jgi:putative glutamine amidotransferase
MGSFMKILVVNDYDGRHVPYYSQLSEDITVSTAEFFENPDKFDLVCFTGGEDVNPALYNHKNLGSHAGESRDSREVLVFEAARKHGAYMTGICRGIQFLNVMCGGTMIQHMKESHGGARHLTQTRSGRKFPVASSHHQMIVPGPRGVVMAWADETISKNNCVYDGEIPDTVIVDEDRVRVTEAIYYPAVGIFGVQYHPEWMAQNAEASAWYLGHLREMLSERTGETDLGGHA